MLSGIASIVKTSRFFKAVRKGRRVMVDTSSGATFLPDTEPLPGLSG